MPTAYIPVGIHLHKSCYKLMAEVADEEKNSRLRDTLMSLSTLNMNLITMGHVESYAKRYRAAWREPFFSISPNDEEKFSLHISFRGWKNYLIFI